MVTNDKSKAIPTQKLTTPEQGNGGGRANINEVPTQNKFYVMGP